MIARDFAGACRHLGLTRRNAIGVVGLGVAMAVCEAAAVLMLLPALEFIQGKGAVPASLAETTRWRLIGDVFATVGLPVSLGGLLALAFLAVLARQVMQFMQRVFTSKVRNGLILHIRMLLFDGFLRADLKAVEAEATGRLLNDFTTEVETAATALLYSLQIMVLVGIFGVYLVSLIGLSAPMTLLSMVIMGVTVFAIRGIFRRTYAIGEATVASNQDVGAFLVERIRSLRLIRLSGTETAEMGHASHLLARQADTRIRADRIVAELGAVVEPVFIGFAFFCLWLGSAHLGLSLEVLGLFLVIVLRLVPIGKDLLGARQIVVQTQPALSLVRERLASLNGHRESVHGGRRFDGLKTGISFEDVRFVHVSDQGESVALDGVTLSIPARGTTALVGPSGGGKSTLIDLLPQLRRPASGRIALDGSPLDSYDLVSLRNGIAFVPQAAQVFDVTVAEHIRYGRPDATDAEVEDAARRANAWTFVSRLPEGLSTRLGEGGARLSGGQRQRLDLARALARGSSILVLDEPTSALDAESEHAFHDALQALSAEGRTTIIVIAHRLSTIASSDQIVVIENGRVTDSGTHRELLSRGGWYARSWTLQTRHDLAEATTAIPTRT